MKTRAVHLGERAVDIELRADGTRIVRNRAPLGDFPPRLTDHLDRWAADAPERTFIAEREGDGWREVTYAQALTAARAIGAALLLATCTLLSFESRMAKIDACLLATVLAAQGALLQAYLGRLQGAGRLNALAFWAALGFGLLLKGPIVLIVSGTTVLGLVLTERRADWLRRLHAGWGVLVMLAIAAPWFVAIGLKTHGGFFDKAIRQNLLGKIGRGEQHHGQPAGYYLLLASLTFWPGALAAAFALPWTWRMRARAQVRFLLCWIAPTWLMYEAVGTKLPHYVLPLYPALACLAAGAAVAMDGWRTGRPGRIAGWLYTGLWGIASALLAAAGPILAWRYAHRIDPIAIGLSVAVLGLCLAAAVMVRRGERSLALGSVTAAAILLYGGFYGRVLPELQPIWLGPRIAALAARIKPCPGSVLASTRFAEPSLVFLEPGETRLIDPVRAADLIASDRACAMAVVSARQMPTFTARASADGLALKARGEVDGVNYSTGERLRLLLFTAAGASMAKSRASP